MSNIPLLTYLLALIYFSTSGQHLQYNAVLITRIDANKGFIMTNQCSRSTPKLSKSYWNVSDDAVVILRKNLHKIYKVKATGCCLKGWQVDSVEKYAYQLVGVTIRGKKYIYLNAFPSEYLEQKFHYWRTDPVIYCDGGNDYWGALFDPKKLAFSQLSVNGS